MKKFLLFFSLSFGITLIIIPTVVCKAQVLVKRDFTFENGKPHTFMNLTCGGRDSSGNIIIASNTVSNLYGETIHIAKSDPDGNLLFEVDENLDSTRDYLFVTDMVLAGTDIYLTGTGIARDSSYSYFLTAKFDSALNNVWGQYYSGPYGGYNAATTIYFEPDSGYLFICGSEQTGSDDYEYTLIKMDTSAGDVVFVAHYDSVGLYDFSTGMERFGNHIAIGALSGKDSTWEMTAAVFNIHSGELSDVIRVANIYGTLNRTVDVGKDAQGGLYLCGVMDSAGFVKMRLIKTTEYLFKLWERDWLVPGSVATVPKAMAIDPQYGFVTITGNCQMAGGGTQLFAVAYLDSDQQWYRTISAPNPAQNAAGNDISLDANDNVFITGSVSNGTDLDFLTTSYTWDGNMRWYKTYKHCDGCNDEGKFIFAAPDVVIVAGTSVGAGDTAYVTIGYKEEADSLGLGVITPKEVLDHIGYSDYVFEGQVIAVNSYFNQARDFIYTSNTIEISKVFKGELECGTVELITLGGTADDTTLWISHNIELNVGEKGIFLAKETDREISSVDFYAETDSVKLYMPYNEQGFMKYYEDGINRFITEDWGAWDSPTPIYNLMQHVSGHALTDCSPPGVTIGGGNSLIRDTFVFPKYTRERYDNIEGSMRQYRNRVRHNGNRSPGTLTYTFMNQNITGTTTKYLEFDVGLSDNISAGWLFDAKVHILYNTSMFGSNIVANNKIAVTRRTVISSTDTYQDPVPVDYSTGVVSIPMFIDTGSQLHTLYELTNTPTPAIHVKMEIANCGVSNSTISMTNNDEMLYNLSAYAGRSNMLSTDTPIYEYDVADNSDTFPVRCNAPVILRVEPQQVNAGVGDSIMIKGYGFGSARGNGGVYMKNCDDGGSTYMALDSFDYILWSDTILQVYIPSTVDTLNSFNNKRGGAGSGNIKVRTNTGDTAASPTALSIFYSIRNTIDTFDASRKKYVNNLFDYLRTGGYRFSVDSSIYNHSDFKSCVLKAIHDWVCLTSVNFQMGNDTVSTASAFRKDNLNLIQIKGVDSANVAARTGQWVTGSCSNLKKVAVSEIDIQINPIFLNRFFADTIDTHSLPSNMVDFYEIILHELGHAHSLAHVNDSTAVMFWQSSFGPKTAMQRKIRLYDDARCYYGGGYVVLETQNPLFITNCGWDTMSLLTTGCSNAFNSLHEVSNSFTLKVYPNPVSDALSVEYLLDNNSKVQVQICDIIGEPVYDSKIINRVQGTYSETVSFSEFVTGFYLVNIRINNQNNIIKIIKN